MAPHATPQQPLVTVITPTLNMGDRLARCLRSVQQQSYDQVEHIIIDAGSNDGTIELLESSPHVTWISEPDRGQSDAINKGLRLSTGDLVGWLNADDELAADALALVVEAARRNPHAGLFYGDVRYVESERTWRRSPDPQFTMDRLCRRNTILQPGTFWTRWAQELVGELDEDYRYAMDYEYWLRFARSGIDAVYLPYVLARFEIHASSKTGTEDGLVFALEEAAALRKHGEDHWAAVMLERSYARKAAFDVARLACEGKTSEAAMLARETMSRLRPVVDTTRWFLHLARWLPQAAGWVYRIRRSIAARRLRR